MFLMMRCSGYVQASRVRVRLLNSSCRMWSSEISCCIINDTFFTAEWVVRVEMRLCHGVGWFFKEFCLEFSGFRKVDLHLFSLYMFLSYLAYVFRPITQFTYFESSHNY